MEFIEVIGSLAFLGALIYLVYHLIRKRKDKERTLPKKFYPVLVGGFLLSMIAGSLTDTSIQDELNEALEANTVLVAENDDFQSKNKELEKANKELTEENEELTLKLADFENMEQELAEQKATHKEKTDALEKEIAELKEKNSKLTTEVDGLKKQVASKPASSTNTTTGSTGTSTSGTTTQSKTSTAPTISGGSEWFQNCTELRKKYPNGVASDHPAYQAKMDRDKDGWACER